MNDHRASGEGIVSEDDAGDTVQYYKKDFWSQENLKFGRPWYRLEKLVRVINKVAQGRECTLLDVGCGPTALMRHLPPNVEYYGIDIAIHEPAPNLIEADLLESPIRFGDKKFDIVIAQGVFEYLGEFQSQKFSEIAQILNGHGKFIVTYTNFGHRKRFIYEPFSNIQSFDQFHGDLARHFTVDKYFPSSHNWKHGHPGRKLVKAANMFVNVNIPFISPKLAVEYFFICSPRESSTSSA